MLRLTNISPTLVFARAVRLPTSSRKVLFASNKIVINDPAYRVKTGDAVRFDGRSVKPQEKVYILLNKPKGYVSTVSDPRHTKTVVSLVKMLLKTEFTR